jgi:hypothetical protein
MIMIGKIVRMLVGRSIARKNGFSGAAGAAAGLLGPIVLKQAGSLLKKRRSVARQRRKERDAPKYLDSITST